MSVESGEVFQRQGYRGSNLWPWRERGDGRAASRTLNVEPARTSLAFRVKDRDVLIVMKGDARVDNRKYKDRFKTKAKFIGVEEVLCSSISYTRQPAPYTGR